MRLRLVLPLLGLLVGPASASADPVVLFTSLSTSGAFDGSTYYVLEDDETQEYAFAFRPYLSGTLVEVRLPIEIIPGIEGRRGGAELRLTLTQASAAEGGPEGPIVEQWTLGHTEVNALVGVSFLSLASQSGAMLAADVNYYLIGRFLSSRTAHWFKSNDATGAVLERHAGGAGAESEGGWNPVGTQRLAAFEVTGNGAPVPEPATVLLCAAGMGALARLRRGRKTAIAGPAASGSAAGPGAAARTRNRRVILVPQGSPEYHSELQSGERSSSSTTYVDFSRQ